MLYSEFRRFTCNDFTLFVPATKIRLQGLASKTQSNSTQYRRVRDEGSLLAIFRQRPYLLLSFFFLLILNTVLCTYFSKFRWLVFVCWLVLIYKLWGTFSRKQRSYIFFSKCWFLTLKLSPLLITYYV